MYGYIYKTTNLINNKIYIGQHKSDKFSLKYLGSGKLLRRAVDLYGKENFKVELLEECQSADELDERERFYIALFNSQDIEIGYNIGNGGQKRFFTGQHHSEEARKKMSDRAKNRPHPPTSKGRIWITNGDKSITIKVEDFEYYEGQGFYKGRVYKEFHSWNKGKTKDTDPTIQRVAQQRKARFENGESIGFCKVGTPPVNGFVKGGTPWNKGATKSTHELSIERKKDFR